jgi:polyisoprenoid-binding protein YceI
MRKPIFLLLYLSVFVAFGQENLAIKSSTVTFKIKNFGSYVDGFFKGFEGKIYFSPQNLAQSSIEASIKAETVNTNNKSRDNHLRKSDYFDVAQYPQITMKSKRFANSQSGDFIGYFDLRIKDKTQEIKLPFSYKTNGNVGTFKGSFTINRRDFGVGDNSMVLGDMVIVNIEIETFLK